MPFRRCGRKLHVSRTYAKYIIYRDGKGNLHCPCNRKDCEHRKAIRDYLGDDGGTDGRGTQAIENECGSEQAKAIQDELNGQHSDSRNGNGNGAQASFPQLDLTDPFQECEQLDIDQIEGRRDGELAWQLSNGEYVISYAGMMKLADKHQIDFPTILRDNKAVIAYAQTDGSLRLSGKPVRTYDTPIETVCELAKRNAARQLLPLPEIKAIEHKAKLNAEFNWQKAKAKCIELVGEANVNIIIRDLVSAGKLRQDNPSHYDRTEWLMIYDACERDAEIERNPDSINRWSYNSAVFLDRCREAIQQVRAKKSIEANEQPLEGDNSKRKLQMDAKFRTWLVEADGTKSQITCREICEKFESKQNPSIVTRLRAGIDSGADISTVELDD